MLRRKPSNASEKEPTQKRKVRSISGNSLSPSLCSLNPFPPGLSEVGRAKGGVLSL